MKYTKLWDGAENSVEKVNSKLVQYRKGFIKIKFNSNDNLSFNKTLKLHNITVTRSILEEDGKFYPQVFLDECFYEL